MSTISSFLTAITGAPALFDPTMPSWVSLIIQFGSLPIWAILLFNMPFSVKMVMTIVRARGEVNFVWGIHHLFMIFHVWTLSSLILYWEIPNWTWLILGFYCHVPVLLFMVWRISQEFGLKHISVAFFLSNGFLNWIRALAVYLLDDPFEKQVQPPPMDP